jgi:hypothetical protein
MKLDELDQDGEEEGEEKYKEEKEKFIVLKKAINIVLGNKSPY